MRCTCFFPAGIGANDALQPTDHFLDHFFGIGKGERVVTGIDKKAMQLCGSGYQRVKTMFLQAPGFLQQPAYPVALYGLTQPFLGYAETYAHRRRFRFASLGQVLVYHPQWENRKRLSGQEKRFNLFTQL